MTRMIRTIAVLLAFVAPAGRAAADVKVEEKSQLKMEGAVGGLLNRFGGKAAKEGVVQTVSVRGDRKLTLGEDSGELVDLAEEKVYRLDPRKKTYTVTTFAELREQAAKAERDARTEEREPRKRGERPPPEEQVEVDLDVKETGKKKTVNGFETRQVITTITTRKKGMTLEEGGGTVITADSWLTRSVKARDEVAEFDRRFVQKVYGKSAAAALGAMAMAAMSAPGMAAGMAKLREQGAKLEGYPIVTDTTVESVKGAEQEGAEKGSEDEDAPTGLGALGGMFAKKVAKKATAKPAGSRSPILSTRNEVLSVKTSVAAEDVSLPPDFKPAKK